MTGVHRGPCTREGCDCQGFDAYPCETQITMPNGRCRIHGGVALVGVANPAFRGRGSSKVLPVRLQEHYENALDDPNLLSLRKQMALLEAFGDEVLQSLKDGTLISGAMFAAAEAVIGGKRDLVRARQIAKTDPVTGEMDQGSSQKIAEAMTKLMDAITGLEHARNPAEQQRTARKEAGEIMMKLRQTKRDENMRLESLHNMLTAERAMALQTAVSMAVIEALNAHVTDDKIRTAVRRDLATRFRELTRRRDD